MASSLPGLGASSLPTRHSGTPERGAGARRRLVRWMWRHLWAFIVLGVLQIVLAFLMVVVYFSIRTLTSSLELVETIPSYATALLVICTGILDMFLYRRNDILLLVLTLLLNMVSCILSCCSVLLTGLLALRGMDQYSTCLYSARHFTCTCSTGEPAPTQQLNGDVMVLYPAAAQYAASDEVYVYEGAASCTVIEHSLKDYMYSLISLHTMLTVLCALGSFLTGLVFKAEKNRQRQFEHSQLDCGGERRRSSTTDRRHSRNSTNPNVMTVGGAGGGLFSRHISLPGHSLVAQQLGLPGEDPARLITVRRMASDAGDGEDTSGSTHTAGSNGSSSPIVTSPPPRHPFHSPYSPSPRSSQHELEQLHVSQLQHWWGRYLQCWHDGQFQQNHYQQQPQPQQSRGVFQSPEPSATSASASHEQRPPRRPRRTYSDLEAAAAAAAARNRGARRRQRRQQRHLRQLRALARQGHFASSYQALQHHHDYQPQQQPSPPPHHQHISPPPPPPPFDRNFYPMSFLQFMHGVTQGLGVSGGCSASGEPPPPYVPVLPPYLEFDPAPSYRSRDAASTLGSHTEEADHTDNTASTSVGS